MKETDIRKYASLMKELDLTGLEITEEGKAVRLERIPTGAIKDSVVVTEPAPEKSSALNNTGTKNDGDTIKITSPIVGVFYSAPSENSEPFVKEGERFKKGSVLCIIEAMKLMNEITADYGGIIEKVCVKNGDVVEYGTELFHVRREK